VNLPEDVPSAQAPPAQDRGGGSRRWAPTVPVRAVPRMLQGSSRRTGRRRYLSRIGIQPVSDWKRLARINLRHHPEYAKCQPDPIFPDFSDFRWADRC